MYFAGGKEYDEKSEKNMKIRKIFCNKEVRAEVTDLVEYVFDTATNQNGPPFGPEDVQYPVDIACPDCGGDELEEVIYQPGMTDVVIDYIADPSERFQCPICGAGYPTQEDAESCCEGMSAYQCTKCCAVIPSAALDEMLEGNEVLVHSWHMVSSWLCKQLVDYNAPVIEDHDIWGRTETGHPVWEDEVIGEICKDLGILDGQIHAWNPPM